MNVNTHTTNSKVFLDKPSSCGPQGGRRTPVLPCPISHALIDLYLTRETVKSTSVCVKNYISSNTKQILQHWFSHWYHSMRAKCEHNFTLVIMLSKPRRSNASHYCKPDNDENHTLNDVRCCQKYAFLTFNAARHHSARQAGPEWICAGKSMKSGDKSWSSSSLW